MIDFHGYEFCGQWSTVANGQWSKRTSTRTGNICLINLDIYTILCFFYQIFVNIYDVTDN